MLSQTKGAGSVLSAAEVGFFFDKRHDKNFLEPSETERQRDVRVTAPPSGPSNRLLIEISDLK